MMDFHLIVVEPFERLGEAFALGQRIAEPALAAAIAAGEHARHVVAVAAPPAEPPVPTAPTAPT
jgi:hypothetical protein